VGRLNNPSVICYNDPMPRHDDYDPLDDHFDEIRNPPRRPRRAYDYEYDRGPKPHSGVGVASMCLAGVAFVAYLIVAGLMVISEIHNANNNAPINDDDPIAILGGLGIVGAFTFNFIGLVLGAVGCFQSDRKPLYAILGAIFNGVVFVGVIAMIVIAIILGA
jgi:hypothetical protein